MMLKIKDNKMPRKYEPYTYLSNQYSDWTYANTEVAMKESKHGQWIPLKVYNDETARLRAQVERLKNENRRIKDSIADKYPNW